MCRQLRIRSDSTLTRAINRWLSQEVGRSWHTLVGYTESRKRARALLRRVVVQWTYRGLCRGWRSFVEVAERRKRVWALLHNATTLWTNNELCRGWRSLVVATLAAAATRQMRLQQLELAWSMWLSVWVGKLGRRFVRGRGLRDAAIQRRRSSESASSECWSPQRLRDLSPGVRVVHEGDTIES